MYLYLDSSLYSWCASFRVTTPFVAFHCSATWTAECDLVDVVCWMGCAGGDCEAEERECNPFGRHPMQ